MVITPTPRSLAVVAQQYPVDAYLALGDSVYADGSSTLADYGNYLVIDHGGGYMSLYGHNEELFRKVGDPVVAGDVIGSVGDSGGHSQPALYFEVRRGKTPVDPQTWLTRK